MTLRDLSQGCWRMRGIGKGQRIKYIVTKEIAQMISRSLGSVVDLSIVPLQVILLLAHSYTDGNRIAAR